MDYTLRESWVNNDKIELIAKNVLAQALDSESREIDEGMETDYFWWNLKENYDFSFRYGKKSFNFNFYYFHDKIHSVLVNIFYSQGEVTVYVRDGSENRRISKLFFFLGFPAKITECAYTMTAHERIEWMQERQEAWRPYLDVAPDAVLELEI